MKRVIVHKKDSNHSPKDNKRNAAYDARYEVDDKENCRTGY